jgi:hypothetical protein
MLKVRVILRSVLRDEESQRLVLARVPPQSTRFCKARFPKRALTSYNK